MTENEFVTNNGLQRGDVQAWRKSKLEKGEDYLWDSAIKQIQFTEEGLAKAEAQFLGAADAPPEDAPTETEPVAADDRIKVLMVGMTAREDLGKAETADKGVIRFLDPKRKAAGSVGKYIYVKPCKVRGYSGEKDGYEFVSLVEEG